MRLRNQTCTHRRLLLLFLAQESGHHREDSPHLMPASVTVICTAVAPEIPARVGVSWAGGRLRVEHDDPICGGPTIIAGTADEVVVNALRALRIRILPAAMKGHVQPAVRLSTSARDVDVADFAEAAALAPFIEELCLTESRKGARLVRISGIVAKSLRVAMLEQKAGRVEAAGDQKGGARSEQARGGIRLSAGKRSTGIS